jgi:hypothetical protein
MAGFADLLRSRLRALLPLGLISIFGLSIYFFFCSLTSHDPEVGFEEIQHPHFRIDGLGRVGTPDFSRAGGLIFDSDNHQPAPAPDLKVYEPDQLMRLPILHRTSQDPFDLRNGFKALRDSKSPWLASTPAGVMLINRLSRNRFPPADSIDASRGSLPPPPPLWPPSNLLKEKHHTLKTPIPKHLIAGLNTSYVWQGKDRILEGKLPKIQWAGFDKPDWESPKDRSNRLERQGWVRRGFQHVWEGYKARAWGHDELKPISGSVSRALISQDYLFFY